MAKNIVIFNFTLKIVLFKEYNDATGEDIRLLLYHRRKHYTNNSSFPNGAAQERFYIESCCLWVMKRDNMMNDRKNNIMMDGAVTPVGPHLALAPKEVGNVLLGHVVHQATSPLVVVPSIE